MPPLTFTKLLTASDGVHHYDEYGLRDINDEPQEIRQIHYEMIEFVREWLKDFKA